MKWIAKNKYTGAETGPHSDEYKNAMESNPSTWRRHTWTPYYENDEVAGIPESIAGSVKPAKDNMAYTTSGVGEQNYGKPKPVAKP